MRHRVDTRKLGRDTSHRKAMLANLVASLIIEESIETTVTRAKEVRRVAERIITLSLIHISEPTRLRQLSRMPSSA